MRTIRIPFLVVHIYFLSMFIACQYISFSAETILMMKWKLPGSLILLLLYCELVMYSPPLHRPGLLMYTWLSIID